MNKTKIDWPWKPLWTWNPISGCLHSCRKTYCYNTMKSSSVLNRYGIRYNACGDMVRTMDWRSRETGKIHEAMKGEIYPYGYDPTFYPHRLNEPQKKKKPCNIFVVDVGDLFGDWVPIYWIESVLNVVNKCPQHTFMFLTKNPRRYSDPEFEFPENCWLGCTVVSKINSGIDKTYYCNFRNIRSNKTFISIEPILSDFIGVDMFGIDLIIIGAMTGKNAVVPKREWVDSIKHPNIYYKENLRKIFPDLKNR